MSVWGNLTIAMLAVGGFSAARVLQLRDSLASAGLLDPANLASWDEARITRELTKAGYERGLLTGMYAERLSRAMRVLAAPDLLAKTQAVLEDGDESEVSQLLLPQSGIGPKVVATFLALRHGRDVGSR